MKKFFGIFSVLVSLIAIPVALVLKYPEKSKEVCKKAEDKGKKFYHHCKKKCCKCK